MSIFNSYAPTAAKMHVYVTILMKQVQLNGTIISNFFEPRSLKFCKISKSTFMIGICLEKNLCNLTDFIIEVQGGSNTAKIFMELFCTIF